jgi:hypothetical protein
MQKWHRELVHRLRAVGISVSEVKQGSKSTRIRCSKDGNETLYFASTSASDYRAMENAVKDITRDLRQKEEHGTHH